MKKLLFLPISIIAILGILSIASFQEQQDDRITNFLNKLPEMQENDSSRIEKESAWSDFLYYSPKFPKFFSPPKIEEMLDFKLELDGVIVREIRHSKANGKIGYATCKDGVPTIVFAVKKNKRITPENFVFFRFHEFAHLKLGHEKCLHNTSKVKRQDEIDADCEAAKLLIQFADGQRIIDRAIGTFSGMAKKQTPTHPSTLERADALDECNY